MNREIKVHREGYEFISVSRMIIINAPHNLLGITSGDSVWWDFLSGGLGLEFAIVIYDGNTMADRVQNSGGA